MNHFCNTHLLATWINQYVPETKGLHLEEMTDYFTKIVEAKNHEKNKKKRAIENNIA